MLRLCKAVGNCFCRVNSGSAADCKQKINVFRLADANAIVDLIQPGVWDNTAKLCMLYALGFQRCLYTVQDAGTLRAFPPINN